MSKEMPKNKYCVVVFRRGNYARYFHHCNTPLLTCANDNKFTIEGEEVQVERDVLPADTQWQNMHLSWS